MANTTYTIKIQTLRLAAPASKVVRVRYLFLALRQEKISI